MTEGGDAARDPAAGMSRRISGKIFRGGRIEGETYADCLFDGCRFLDVAMESVDFANCVFQECELRKVSFTGCSMLGGLFRRCDVVGVDWSEIRRHGRRLPLLLGMAGCLLKYNTFVKMGLPGVDFSESQLLDCHFQECDLREALFVKANLESTVFDGCNLGKADFRGAVRYSINIHSNNISKAHFSLPDVVGLLGSLDIDVEV